MCPVIPKYKDKKQDKSNLEMLEERPLAQY